MKTTSFVYACGGVTGHATECDRSLCFRLAGNARERREALIQGVVDLGKRDEWEAAYNAAVKLGPSLGRSERWQGVCQWFVAQKAEERPVKWIVVQGSVFLGLANA